MNSPSFGTELELCSFQNCKEQVSFVSMPSGFYGHLSQQFNWKKTWHQLLEQGTNLICTGLWRLIAKQE